jgi:hypothetical protein
VRGTQKEVRMQNQQDYIQPGSTLPIVLAPYEVVPISGVPIIRVENADLYIKVRDILLARQLGMVPRGKEEGPVGWAGSSPESLAEPGTPEEAQDPTVAHVEAPGLGEYVDQMLGALSGNDLIDASRILIEVIACLGGDRQELRAIVGIFAKILGNCVKKGIRE